MFFTPTLDSNWFIVQKASRYLMIILAIAMLAMPLLVQPKAEADAGATLLVLGAIGAGVALGTLAATLWNNAWIDCPAGCPNKVQRKNQDRDLIPCTQCGVPLWQCIGNHERVCQVSGCQVNNQTYFVCPPRDDGADMSTDHLHGDGVCNDNGDGASSSNNSSS